jgi:hypothetical protein
MKSRSVSVSRLYAARSALALILALLAVIDAAPECSVQANAIVARGWHPWYEVQVDPEDRTHMVICGSRWDSEANALVGFVYTSVDSGQTWRVALEDKSTTWVSEHSCAIGPGHTVYFISEASDVVEGMPNHRRGTARLYVSTDGGGKWEEAVETGWADWTTSAVASKSGKLAVFFHYTSTPKEEKGAGSNIGVLTFSKDEKKMSGPVVNAEIGERNYQGIYPSNALSLRDGTVAALYYGRRPENGGFDLGLVRANVDAGEPPQFSEIAHAKSGATAKCFSGLGDYGLAYDGSKNRLLAVYRDETNGKCGLMLATSDDSGVTWTNRVLGRNQDGADTRCFKMSVAVNSQGELGVLWSDGGARWRFAKAGNSYVLELPVEMWANREPQKISNDALWIVFRRSTGGKGAKSTQPALTVNVRSFPSRVWRASGLIAMKEGFYVIGLTGEAANQGLYGVPVGANRNESPVKAAAIAPPMFRDVTGETNLVYGGTQTFDEKTGTLAIDVQLVNHAKEPLQTPLYLVAEDVRSEIGRVTILNADNGFAGPGASWDLSRSVTGNQIPAGAAMFNSVRLLFHIDISEKRISTNRLLSFDAKVFCGAGADR